MKVGIIGCGVISKTYIKDLRNLFFLETKVQAVSDLDLERAKAAADQFSIPKACTIDEILADPEVELIINLTPPLAHTEINRRILAAGKHLFCEKPFALTLEEARETVEIARRNGRRIGCAPDTFLGSAQTTCRKLLRQGWIGKPLYVNANMMSSGVEIWHPSPESFYQKGGGPLYDMGEYYLSAMVTMFGSAKQVIALSDKGYKERTIYTKQRFGHKFPVSVDTFYALLIRMSCGIIITMNISFDIWKSSLPLFEIYGTDGSLMVPDPNMYGGSPKVYRREQTLKKVFAPDEAVDDEEANTIPELSQNVGTFLRGMGVADMVRAIRNNTDHAANERLAIHVLEIITGAMKAAADGRPYNMTTEYEPYRD